MTDPADDATGDPGDGDGDDLEERDPFKRRVAITIAVLAVLGGFISLLETDAGNSESTTARETTRTGVKALSASVTDNAVAGLDVDVAAEQEALAAGPTFSLRGDTIDGLAGLSGATEDERADLDAAIAGLEPDAEGETRREDLAVEAERLTLKQQALAESRVTWNNRASQYGTVITTLGVAIFLVGFTLVLNRRIRPPVLVPGLALAAYCLGWALWIHERPVPETPDTAVTATAEGTVALGAGVYDDAVADLDRAVDAADDYDTAFSRRSAARFLAANPDFVTTGAVVDTESEQIEMASEDAERSVELSGGRGFLGLFVLGLQQFYQGDYDAAVATLDQAVEANDVAPEATLLRASAEIGRGNLEAAERSFDETLALLDLGEASQRNRLLVSDGIDQLEHLAHADPERSGIVSDLQREVIRGESELVFGALDAVDPGDAAVSIPDLTYADGTLSGSPTWTDLPDDAQVSVYIFERPREGEAWVQPFDAALFSTLSGSGSTSGGIETPRACEPVAFRVDVYLGGELLSSEESPGGEPTC